jgi:hypothetical protein
MLNLNILMLFEELLAGGDVELIVVYGKHSSVLKKMNDCFERSARSSSNVEYILNFRIIFISLSNQSVGVSM